MNGYKKTTNLMASSFVMALSCTLLFSCNDEEFIEGNDSGKSCDNICFGISPDGKAQTRGNAGNQNEEYTYGRFVLRSKDSVDTICVSAIVSDGIHLSDSDDQRIISRGAPVTKENFYESFHVLAYWKKEGTLVETQFYMDEGVTDRGNNLWGSEKTYYWPGIGHSLKFYAWAPTDAGFTSTPSAPTSTALEYTVPSHVVDQKDIVVASPEETDGNHNAPQLLTFRHICTAVRFEIGSRMQPGTIKSVALRDVHHKGTYDMESGVWNLDESTLTFSQELNMRVTGFEESGTGITSAESTFMMLPQTLPDRAMLEVVFTNSSGKDITYIASIGGTEWTIGTTVTYKLSITPEYELEFVSQPEAQDAHYVIYPITVKADKLPTGGWTLTSNDAENVTFVEKDKFVSNDVQALVDAGYWLEDYNGTNTLTSTTTGAVQVYVFLKENVTETDRNITLSLRPAAQGNYESKEFSFTQYCPAWNNGIGVERIQDEDYPWGFNWDSNMTITYNLGRGLGALLAKLYLEWFARYKYVTTSGLGLLADVKVTIDFSKVGQPETATDLYNGIQNTWELYSFNGVNEVSALITQLESWGGIPDKILPTNPAEFAARACAMKNKYRVQIKVEQGNTIYRPVLDQANLLWYLPAQNEAPLMNDNLSGDYWTSTAIIQPGNTAYKYTAGGSTSPWERNEFIHVRAIRKL